MVTNTIPEPRWNSTAHDDPVERPAPSPPSYSAPRVAERPALGRYTWFRGLEDTVMVLAMVIPLLLVVLLCVFISRPQWKEWMPTLVAPKPVEEQAAETNTDTPAETEQGKCQLGKRAVPDAEMKYQGKGRAHLGQYSIKIYDPVTNTTLRTDFALEGDTMYGDSKDFEQWVASHHCFFREQVMVALRNGDITDFTDPRLTLLSRKLVAQVNRAFGRPFLKDIKFKGFCLYESVQNSDFVLWEEANGGDH